jgi:hypothetical protein
MATTSEERDAPLPPGAPDGGEDPTAFILDRTRSEVHLLLDNISANPDVTLAALTERLERPRDLPEDWITQVCEITWPPQGATPSPDQLAKDAALLIRARDYLNGLAKPASGATIAFTLMVTQEENPRARRRRLKTGGGPPTPSRSSLAGDAYPDLVDRARHFRAMMSRVVWVAVIALGITLFISWYLAIGNAALTDYGTSRAALTKAEGRVGEAQSAYFSNSGPAQSEAGTDTGPPLQTGQPQQPMSGTSPPASPPTYFANPCETLGAQKFYPSAALREACGAWDDQLRTHESTRAGLVTWVVGASPEAAAWWANLLGTAVLPVLYGFLGAIASVVRTWSRKIKRSLLSPRDMQLSLQQLALGALIGACISLFIAAPAAGDADSALLGPVALSSSAISFVAGFGVDSVFQALEALISRIFNIAPAGTVARDEGRPPG